MIQQLIKQTPIKQQHKTNHNMIILDEQYNDAQGLGFRQFASAAKALKKNAPAKGSFIKRAANKSRSLIRKKMVAPQTAAIAPRPNFFNRAVGSAVGAYQQVRTLLPAPAQENFTVAELAEFQDTPVGQLTPVASVASSSGVVATAVMPSNPTPTLVSKAENTATMEQIATASIDPVGGVKAVVAVAPIVVAPPKPKTMARTVAPESVLDAETAQEAIGDLTPVTAVAPASQEMRNEIMQKVANETANVAPNAPQPKNNTIIYAGVGVAVIAAVVLMNKKK